MWLAPRGSMNTVCQMPLVVVYHFHCLPTGCSWLSIGSSTRSTISASRAAILPGERVGDIELERRVAAFVVAEMFPVHPAIGEKIRRADGEDDAFACPRCAARNRDTPAIPADFVARRGAMVGAGDLQRIFENARGVIIVVPRGIAIAPGRERFPAKRHDDLLAPFARLRRTIFPPRRAGRRRSEIATGH